MRTSTRRALALAAATPLLAASVVGGATGAHAAPSCPESTDVVDFTVVAVGRFRVAVRPDGPTTTYVCVQAADTIQAVVIVRSDTSVTPPSVTTTPGAGDCATRIVTVDDPEDFTLSVGADAGAQRVCVGSNGTTTTLSFGLPAVNALPSVEVWLPAYSFLVMYGACATPFALYTADPSTTNYNRWVSCYNGDRKYP